jgi:FkbM family methyltransferase
MLSELLESRRKKTVISVEELKCQLNGKPFVLYGAGIVGSDILEILRKFDILPVALSDTNRCKWHKRVSEVEVVPPAELAAKFGTDILVIACFYLNVEENMVNVRRILSRYDITDIHHVSFFMCCPELFLPLRGRRSQLEIFDVISSEQREGIERGYLLMSDDRSKELYRQMIEFRCFLQGAEPLLDGDTDYFAFDNFAPRQDEVFVDCGAYTGDTLQEFLENYNDNFQQYIAFEPDPVSFGKLKEHVNSLQCADKIKLFQAALSDFETTLRFDADGGVSSAVSQTGTEQVSAVPMDAALNGVSVSFIKLDVEGFERNALLGAIETIERCRPVLAVCVYHMLDDIWQLPLLLEQLCHNYKFFLQARNFLTGYCVFAVPAERAAIKERS